LTDSAALPGSTVFVIPLRPSAEFVTRFRQIRAGLVSRFFVSLTVLFVLHWHEATRCKHALCVMNALS